MNLAKYQTLLKYVRDRSAEQTSAVKRRQANRTQALGSEFIDRDGELTEYAQLYLARGAGRGFKDLATYPGVTRNHGFFSRKCDPFVIRLDFQADTAEITVFGPNYSAWVGAFEQSAGRELFLSLRAEDVETCEGLRRIR